MVLVDGATKRQVALLATGIGGAGDWEDTEVIVSVNHLLKEWDVQSGFQGDTMCRSDSDS